MNRFLQFLGALALALLFVSTLSIFGARAEDVVVTPGAAAMVPEGTNVVIPWGAWLSDLASTIGTLIFAIVVWGLRKLPQHIVAILKTVQAEQLLQKAIDYGINATADAAKDRTLSINVANSVIASAASYAVENGAPTIIRWLDGAEGISQKVIARLKVEDGAQAIKAPDGTSLLSK
jgi:hypothetical protein